MIRAYFSKMALNLMFGGRDFIRVTYHQILSNGYLPNTVERQQYRPPPIRRHFKSCVLSELRHRTSILHT